MGPPFFFYIPNKRHKEMLELLGKFDICMNNPEHILAASQLPKDRKWVTMIFTVYKAQELHKVESDRVKRYHPKQGDNARKRQVATRSEWEREKL